MNIQVSLRGQLFKIQCVPPMKVYTYLLNVVHTILNTYIHFFCKQIFKKKHASNRTASSKHLSSEIHALLQKVQLHTLPTIILGQLVYLLYIYAHLMKPRKKFCHDDLNDSVSNDDDFDDDLDDHDDKHAFFFKGVVFPFCFQLQPLSSLSFGDFSILQLSNSTIIIKHQIKLVFFT